MSARTRWLRLAMRWVVPMVGAASLALAVFFYTATPRERAYRLTISAGNPLETRHQLLLGLRHEAAKHNITLDLASTSGSTESLQKVNSGTLELALVQGGVRSDHPENVRQVASLQIEPLHLLVKQELYEHVSRHLKHLAGKRVNLSSPNSGSNLLATEVLAFVGLHPQSTQSEGYIALSMSGVELMEEQDRSRLPDAVFLVSSLPSATAKHLVTRHDYRLIAMPFGEAFALDGAPHSEPEDLGQVRIDKSRVADTRIPAFCYSVEPAVPAAPLPTLGTALLLVARKDVDAEAVQRLLEIMLQMDLAKSVRAGLDGKGEAQPPEYAWHSGTLRYQARNRPIVSGMMMDFMQKAAAIFAAGASGLFVLYQWTKLRTQFMRDRGFTHYINQVTRIEEAARRLENAPDNMADLRALRDKLHQLKTEALDRFTDGELTGKELMTGFVAQVNDVRDYVIRLLRTQEAATNPSLVNPPPSMEVDTTVK